MCLKLCIQCWYFALIMPSATIAIMCYVCGQTNLKPPGECTTQFQYDCSTLSTATSQRGSKLFCRTTRSKIGENMYSVGKECINEHDHLTRYPDGKISGCDTLDKNGSHELSYCICDKNLCNAKNIDDQINEHKQQQQHVITNSNPVVVGLPSDGINISIGAWPVTAGALGGTRHLLNGSLIQGQSSVPDPPRFPNITSIDPSELRQANNLPSVPNQQRTIETSQQHSIETVTVNSMQIKIQPSNSIIFANNESNKQVSTKASNALNVQTVETHHMIIGTEHPQIAQPFFCSSCAETNVTDDCKKQTEDDCRKLFPTEEHLFCFTKGTILNGVRVVEKRCASRESVSHDLGLTYYGDGCNQTSPNSPVVFQYCFCSSNNCNNVSIAEQINNYKQPYSHKDVEKSKTNNTAPLICYSCSESNLNRDADCSRQYENDCKSQEQSKSNIKMYCLTRQTKQSSGLFSIEKRCISEMEHRQQHPGTEVVLNGCREGLNHDEYYCTCENSFCNKLSIMNQKENRQNENIDRIQTISQQFTVFPHTSTDSVPSTLVTLNDQNGINTQFKSLKKSDLTISNTEQSKKDSNKQISDKNSSSVSHTSLFRFQYLFSVLMLFVFKFLLSL